MNSFHLSTLQKQLNYILHGMMTTTLDILLFSRFESSKITLVELEKIYSARAFQTMYSSIDSFKTVKREKSKERQQCKMNTFHHLILERVSSIDCSSYFTSSLQMIDCNIYLNFKKQDAHHSSSVSWGDPTFSAQLL